VYKFPDYLTEKGITLAAQGERVKTVYCLEVIG
jgi:hypothetical protein